MSWRPNAGPSVARLRARLLATVRRFFSERSVLEVTTPVLGNAAPTDPSVDAVAIRDRGRTAYLQTSPEYFMKRLLAAGYPDIYQIAPVFRGGEQGSRHLPEFTMIEWYRLDCPLDAIIAETAALIGSLLSIVDTDDTAQVSYRDAFVRQASIDPLQCDPAAIADLLEADEGLRASLGEDTDAWLDLLLATRVAPAFPADRLTVVSHYPASQAALARLAPGDPRVAERFEVFLGDLELANGYVELTDPDEQRDRFATDLVRRRRAGLAEPSVDDALLAALDAGLPACAGVALGFERVLMCEAGARQIGDVVTFLPGA